MLHRKEDTTETWFHGERIYRTDEGWWFSSREHTDEGPYESQAHTEREVHMYLNNVEMVNAIVNEPLKKSS